MTIPSGTSLPLALTSGIASDTSALEDAVSAELTRAISINGREVLPAGTRLTGFVTAVDDSNRVKRRASISFRFTSLHAADTQYDLQSAALLCQAPATKGEDAAKIGIGAGAGAVIGRVLAARTARRQAPWWVAAPEPLSCSPPRPGNASRTGRRRDDTARSAADDLRLYQLALTCHRRRWRTDLMGLRETEPEDDLNDRHQGDAE